MVTDHSKTYKLNDLRNIAHVMRLRAILRTLRSKVRSLPQNYADFGCSNGFITNQVAQLLNVSEVSGYDYTDNVDVGAELYPDIRFQRLDLNKVYSDLKTYDLVTCFETLEHVGNLPSAVENICKSRKHNGFMLITVPIEIGFIGLIKYAIKRLVFRYDLPLACSDFEYVRALLSGKRISIYRVPESGYGSHFGFDYRDVDELLDHHAGVPVEAWNSGTTRFYILDGR